MGVVVGFCLLIKSSGEFPPTPPPAPLMEESKLDPPIDLADPGPDIFTICRKFPPVQVDCISEGRNPCLLRTVKKVIHNNFEIT